MNTVRLIIPSTVYHCSQIITGFLMLRDQGWNVELECRFREKDNPFYDLPVVLAQYRGKTLVYDLWDGYQNPEGMEKGLKQADFYFKRSFSAEKNAALFPGAALYPLGLNYHVTHPDNPINEPAWKAAAKALTGRTPERFFRPEVFQAAAQPCDGRPKILFLAQLWEEDDPSLPPALIRERQYINAMRLEILRGLTSRFGTDFTGGLVDSPLARSRAPELVLSRRRTERRAYLGLVHAADICIGTMGLHESIGWKTAEYVAAARAIVNERPRYSVPGAFRPGRNYLAFDDAAGCIAAVERLAADPEAVYQMKQANEDYYRRFLRPDALVGNTLTQVDTALE